jgi:hypothetical protein
VTPTDSDAQTGFFARVIDGPHRDRYGVVDSIDGDHAILRTRDDHDEKLRVRYSHLRPDTAGKR